MTSPKFIRLEISYITSGRNVFTDLRRLRILFTRAVLMSELKTKFEDFWAEMCAFILSKSKFKIDASHLFRDHDITISGTTI